MLPDHAAIGAVVDGDVGFDLAPGGEPEQHCRDDLATRPFLLIAGHAAAHHGVDAEQLCEIRAGQACRAAVGYARRAQLLIGYRDVLKLHGVLVLAPAQLVVDRFADRCAGLGSFGLGRQVRDRCERECQRVTR